MDQVWVAETWSAHSEDRYIHGVFDSREAAFESLKALPNMTVYVDERGNVRGRPVKERSTADLIAALSGHRFMGYVPEKWASAEPYEVQARKQAD